MSLRRPSAVGTLAKRLRIARHSHARSHRCGSVVPRAPPSAPRRRARSRVRQARLRRRRGGQRTHRRDRGRPHRRHAPRRLAVADGVVSVVLQVDSSGVAVSERPARPRWPTAITGARRPGLGLDRAVRRRGARRRSSSSSRWPTPPASLPDPTSATPVPNGCPRTEFGELLTGKASVARTSVLSGKAAVDAGVVDRFSPTIGDHIVNLDGVDTDDDTKDGERAPGPRVHRSLLQAAAGHPAVPHRRQPVGGLPAARDRARPAAVRVLHRRCRHRRRGGRGELRPGRLRNRGAARTTPGPWS